jgi:anti-sigma factor RsiW
MKPMALQCNEMRADLVAFVDGELDGVRAEEVRSHLTACAACAAEAEAHRSVWAALGVMDVDAPVDSGWLDRVEAVIVDRPAAPIIPWRWLAAAAALALAVGLGLGSSLMSGSGPVAVNPTGPAPERTLAPESPAPTQPLSNPSPAATPSAVPSPSASPLTWPDEPGLAQRDPYEGLSPEEIEVIANLDVLVYLNDAEDAELLENLELLEDLDEDELEEVG